MRNQANIYANGRMRVVDIPGPGSYDLMGQGHGGEYVKSSWAFACIGIRATALAQIPWRITRKGEVVEKHPLIELLNSFAPEGSWNDAFKATESGMLLKGAGYWLRDGERLARLNPGTMSVETSQGGVVGFVQRVSGKETKFAPDEIVYFREFHPTDDLGPGVAAIDVAKQAILAEYEAQRYIKSFFENDALPGLLLTTDQSVPQAELTRLEAWWKSKFGGSRKAHKTAFVDKGLIATVLSSDLRSMALEEVRNQARRDICTAFQVPMVLVGDLDAANFATAHEARLLLYQEVILPRADYYADVINAQLVQAIDPSVQFEFAVDELAILAEDKNAKATRLVQLEQAGIVNGDYVRAELGIPNTAAPVEQPEQSPDALRSWRRKALKAVKAGKSANVAFETDEVALPLQAAIRARLEQAKTAEDVSRVFAD